MSTDRLRVRAPFFRGDRARRTLAAEYDVVGIYAVGETLVEPTGPAADYFDLPFPGLRAARACRSKYLQRWYMPDLSPASVLIPPGGADSVDYGSVPFPAVVKPTARHSERGCLHGERPRRVGRAAGRLSGAGDHPGGAEDHRSGVLDREPDAGRQNPVRLGHAQGDDRRQLPVFRRDGPHRARPTDDAWDAVQRANAAMLDRLGVENGLTHAEFRLDAWGEARLIEVAARTPGDGIMVLYRLATGRPMEPEILRIALGEPADYPAARRYARQVYVATSWNSRRRGGRLAWG